MDNIIYELIDNNDGKYNFKLYRKYNLYILFRSNKGNVMDNTNINSSGSNINNNYVHSIGRWENGIEIYKRRGNNKIRCG